MTLAIHCLNSCCHSPDRSSWGAERTTPLFLASISKSLLWTGGGGWRDAFWETSIFMSWTSCTSSFPPSSANGEFYWTKSLELWTGRVSFKSLPSLVCIGIANCLIFNQLIEIKGKRQISHNLNLWYEGSRKDRINGTMSFCCGKLKGWQCPVTNNWKTWSSTSSASNW